MRIIALAVFLSLSGNAIAGDTPPPAHDGDTFYTAPSAETPACSRLRWKRWESVRPIGLDAPEIDGDCAAERQLAAKARRRLIELLESGPVAIDRRGCDIYDRTLAKVTVAGRDVADILISEGLARPYGGGHRQPWCGD